MCSRNTSSLSQKKSQRLCATSRAGLTTPRPRRLLLALTLGPLLLASLSLARAQDVERSELPPLPGADPADLGRGAPAAPPPLTIPPSPGLVPQPSGPASAASPLPYDLWRGVDARELERLLAGAALPSPSPVLAGLVARALATGDQVSGDEILVRISALERAGRAAESAELLERAATHDPRLLGHHALALLALGRIDEACDIHLGEAFQGAVREALLVPAFCATTKGDAPGAKLALQLAREGGAEIAVAAAVLGQRQPAIPKSPGVIDYFFLSLAEKRPTADLAAKARPALLFLLARDATAPSELRVAAAERAASLNIVAGEDLARAYRETAQALPKTAGSPPALRARLFSAFENAPSVKIRAESIAALLESARDQGIEVPIAEALARASAGLVDDPQAASFAETGIRVAALAGDEQSAWAWVDAGGKRVANWQLLLAATDPLGRRADSALRKGVDLAMKGGLPPALLHRLVTVLDALDYDVPIPLWDAASKTPQPGDGDLPATGALTSLKEAADAGEVGRTVLMVTAVLGPNGAKGAHLIALGDSLRALKRIGLDAEARRLGFEALYAHWPSRRKA
jgi:hypothetical protein